MLRWTCCGSRVERAAADSPRFRRGARASLCRRYGLCCNRHVAGFLINSPQQQARALVAWGAGLSLCLHL